MGERKGQNHYYPPDFDPAKHGNLNRYHGTHALRERAAKIHLGILIIRFEMPYNIWCLGCENHVAMGVRYNAEKKKVGDYYSTPIYEFKMRCHRCENYFIIRTDPKNFDYECVEGLKRKEQRWDAEEYGDAVHDRTKSLKLASDAMYKLEHVETDKKKQAEDEPQIEQIEAIQDRMDDDFSANQYLRHKFRERKKELAAEHASDSALLAKSSLPADLKLLPEDEQDRRLANLMAQYRTVKSSDEHRDTRRKSIASQSIFAAGPSSAAQTSSSQSASITSESPLAGVRAGLKLSSQSKSGGSKRTHKLAVDNLVVRKKSRIESTASEQKTDSNEEDSSSNHPSNSAHSADNETEVKSEPTTDPPEPEVKEDPHSHDDEVKPDLLKLDDDDWVFEGGRQFGTPPTATTTTSAALGSLLNAYGSDDSNDSEASWDGQTKEEPSSS